MIPVALFAYSRPFHLNKTLDCLKANKISLIYSFSDGPRCSEDVPRVQSVREILRSVDWCDIRIIERKQNLGLGTSIRTGVTDVLKDHEAVIVFEDDLICVDGAYAYLVEALMYYQDDDEVMSVTGWTHPRVIPPGVDGQPYFDGRAESLAWGTWARSWEGMHVDAMTLVKKCKAQGIDVNKYGFDLLRMARKELLLNIWAVRFLYLHILKGGLCLRPPWSMVEHIGGGPGATNVVSSESWAWENPVLKSCPAIPTIWPRPIENPHCSELWKRAEPQYPVGTRIFQKLKRLSRKYLMGSIN